MELFVIGGDKGSNGRFGGSLRAVLGLYNTFEGGHPDIPTLPFDRYY